MGKNPALNLQGQASYPSILLPLRRLSICCVVLRRGVFLAEGGRRVRSRQVELLCGWSSWQLPANPVGFVFFLEPRCSETLIYMWPVASSWHMPGRKPAVTCRCMQTPAEGPAGQQLRFLFLGKIYLFRKPDRLGVALACSEVWRTARRKSEMKKGERFKVQLSKFLSTGIQVLPPLIY